MSNIVTAVFRDGATSCLAPGLWQWDYGQILQITGVELPRAVEVHFAQGQSVGTRIGTTEGNICEVKIPDILLTSTIPIDAYIFLHTGEDDGETEYHIGLPVKARPRPVQYDPEDPGVSEAYQALVEATEKIEQAAATAGFMEIGVNDTGHLIYTRSDTVDVELELSGGHLIAEVG